MVKIVSLIIFVGSFIWTWCMFNAPSDMGIDIHASLQTKLTLLIEDSIKARKPDVSQFKLLKMYTEKLDQNKVKAVFTYQYDEALKNEGAPASITTQNVSGEAILIKTPSENPQVQKWDLQNIKLDNLAVDFKEGLTVSNQDLPQQESANTNSTNSALPSTTSEAAASATSATQTQ